MNNPAVGDSVPAGYGGNTQQHYAQMAALPDMSDLRELFLLLRRRLRLILFIGAAFAALALSVSFVLPLKYRAVSLIMLDPRQTSVVDLDAIVSQLPPDAAAIRSEIDIITSRAVIDRVIDDLGLMSNPDFNTRLQPESWLETAIDNLLGHLLMDLRLNLGVDIDLSAGEPHEEDVPGIIRAEVAKRVEENLSVTNNIRSYIIRIGFSSEDPAFAAKVANTVTDEYLVDQLEAKYEMAQRANHWLAGRLDSLRGEVQANEKAVEDFKNANNLTGVGEGTITQQQLLEINSKLVSARGERSQAEARLKSTENLVARRGSIEAAAEVLSSPLIQRLNEQEAEVRRKIAELSNRYGGRHPTMINARAELRDIQAKLAEEGKKIIIGLQNEVDIARAKERSLQRELDRLEERAGVGNQAMVTLRQLEREAAASRALYESFLERFKQVTEQQDLQMPDARVIAKATVPDRAYFPDRKLFLLGGLFLGLFIGTAFVLMLEYLDRGIRSVNQLPALFGQEGIGMIPALKGIKSPADYVVEKPLSAYGEALRTVRTAIHFSNIDNPPKVVVVASSVPGEGKTTFCVSLGRLLAKGGNKVLVIDSDLRRSRIHKVLGQDPEKGDLVGLLAGTHALEDVLQIDEASGMHFITAKSNTPSPQDLLGSQAMENLLTRLRDEYDLVIVDSPPIIAVSDAAMVSRAADCCVYIVQWARTPRDVVRQGLKQIRSFNIKLAGIVLSQVDLKAQGKYGYGDYGYYYARYKDYYVS